MRFLPLPGGRTEDVEVVPEVVTCGKLLFLGERNN